MRLRVIAVAGALLFAGISTAAKADQFVVNGVFAPANSGVGYGAVSGWTESSTAQGSNNPGGAFWDNGAIPGGTLMSTAGFIQGNGSFSQTLMGLTPGNVYTLSFLDNARLGAGCVPACNATPTLTVLLNGGTLIGPTAVTAVGGSNQFDSISIEFIATTASELLDFSSMTPTVPGTNAGADGALLLTDVSVSTTSAVPEPSSLMLLGTGFVGAAGMMRRRFLRS